MEQSKPEYHVVSLSGGKDSTAMLLMMLEKGMPVDDILFCDTGLEFPGLYAHLEKVEQYIGGPLHASRHRIPLSTISASIPFAASAAPLSLKSTVQTTSATAGRGQKCAGVRNG